MSKHCGTEAWGMRAVLSTGVAEFHVAGKIIGVP